MSRHRIDREIQKITQEASYLATHARLWDRLKAELEEEARGKNPRHTPGEFASPGFVETEESKAAEAFLERMRRMEDRV